MALATFSDLKSAIASWIVRDDLTTSIPDFITIFEAVANRTLRVRQMETSTSLTTSSGSVALPSDYIDWRSVTWAGSSSRELGYVSPTIARARFNTSTQGTSTWFTIEGGNFKTFPPDDSTAVTFRYYQKIPALSDSNTTNWLLTAYPDLYLFGCLVEANAFIINADAAALWKGRRDELFAEVQALGELSKGGGSSHPLTWIV
jgi:hypothetical protein